MWRGHEGSSRKPFLGTIKWVEACRFFAGANVNLTPILLRFWCDLLRRDLLQRSDSVMFWSAGKRLKHEEDFLTRGALTPTNVCENKTMRRIMLKPKVDLSQCAWSHVARGAHARFCRSCRPVRAVRAPRGCRILNACARSRSCFCAPPVLPRAGRRRLAPLLVAVGKFQSQLDDQLPLLFNQRLLLCDLCFQNLNRLQLRDHSVW